MKFGTAPRSQSSSKLFLKIEDGKTVTGVIRGDAQEAWVKWVKEDGVNHSVESDEGDPEAKKRYRFNFVIIENGAFTVKIWDHTWNIHETLLDLNEGFPLKDTILTVKRTGKGQNDTRYSIQRALEYKIIPEVETQLAALKLHDLTMKDSTSFNPEEMK